MSESLVSILVIFAEVGILLAIAVGFVVYIFLKRRRSDRALVVKLVKKLKENEAVRREHLLEILKQDYELDDEEAEKKADGLLGFEKRIYNRVTKFFIGKEKDKISNFDKDVQALAQGYSLLGKQAAEVVEKGRDNEHILRKENQELRKKNAKLEADLEASMESMETMMAEYANMYEGGSKEGEQRLKNEMYQLKQKLQNKDAGKEKLTPEDLEEIPDMDPEDDDK
ncbi:MAG: hypothetical protein PVJ63_07985 [Thioalkalispiraceae bacterium]|jgi:hypothetical protein